VYYAEMRSLNGGGGSREIFIPKSKHKTLYSVFILCVSEYSMGQIPRKVRLWNLG
jgi:hypothetical protein